ncbi:MAG TPA: FAD-dependent oxidoreductase [Burkholderiales bacterium]|nr:FAD-dependent oxidoreductase [Burkholderiales bacterium]
MTSATSLKTEPETERVVIVGAGQAGGRAAEALRAAGFAGEIVLFGEERHEPYERPRLSKSVLLGEEPAAAASMHPREWYAGHGIALRTRSRVEAIAPKSRSVITADGQRVEYSKLLLCTGSRVRPLTGAPEGLPGVHYLRTLEDSERLTAELQPGRRLVVIGGGFIGLEVASSALKRGLAVTVVERQPALLDRALPAGIAAHVASLHAAHGASLRLGVPVARIQGNASGNGSVKSVQLADGVELPADLVVIGIGIIPNTELAETAGAASSDGLVVDEYCRTTLEHVYAAGDVTNHYNPILERRVRLESWQNAQNQAIAAAENLAGKVRPYAEVPWFWSDQHGTNIQMVGVAEPAMQIVWRGERLAFGLVNDRLRLAVGFNTGAEIRSARRLIEARAQLSAHRLADSAVRLKDLLTEATCSASTP